MFWALAMNQDYIADRVNLFVAAAPVTRMAHSSMGARLLSHMSYHIWDYAKSQNMYGLFTPWDDSSIKGFFNAFIIGPIIQNLIKEFVKTIDQGSNIPWGSPRKFYFPAEASFKEFDHYAQLLEYGDFAEFDETGDSPPVLIPIQNISKVPIGMFVGQDDPWADPTDAEWARSQIQSVAFFKIYPGYYHGTFTSGPPIITEYLTDALALIKQYNPLY